MPKAEPFERHTERYDDWFDAHEAVYRSELDALRRLVPDPGYGVEVGVGSARFGAPLGMSVGVDPAADMLERARQRGLRAVRGVAESLPFPDDTFDTALLVTTVCFVDDLVRALTEARRVLTDDGAVVVGYVDRDSPVGREYQAKRSTNPFYREAVFVSTDELRDALATAGFSEFAFTQTLSDGIDEVDSPQPVKTGYGDGSFVGIRASP